METSTRHAGDEENLLAKNRHKTPFTRHGGAQVRVYEYSGTTDYDYVVLSEFSETPVSSLALSNTEIPSDATAPCRRRAFSFPSNDAYTTAGVPGRVGGDKSQRSI